MARATARAGPTAATAVREASAVFDRAGIETARLDAQVLLGFVLGTGREGVFCHPERTLSPPEEARFTALVARREARQPVPQLLESREFWGRNFVVTPDTLTPRPETESIIEAVLEKLAARPSASKLKILDLGTGTGCLLLTLLAEIPGADGLGVDISEAALCVARLNSRNLGLDGRAEFVHGDWCSGLSAAAGFDVIVSNPPYISDIDWPGLEPEVTRFEPATALRGGTDGLDQYRILASQVAGYLAPSGVAIFEIGADQGHDVARILTGGGLNVEAIRPDLAGIDRIVIASPGENRTRLKK